MQVTDVIQSGAGSRKRGLHAPLDGESNCGVGAVVALDGSATQALVDDALTLLENLDHRGARGAEENTGDGAGILLNIDTAFFAKVIPAVADVSRFAIGQVFVAQSAAGRQKTCAGIEARIREEGFELLGWREVPTCNDGLGETAVESEPAILQFAVAHQHATDDADFDARVYVLRRLLEKDTDEVRRNGGDDYLCSLHRRLVVYKGLLTCKQLRRYFPDLADPGMRSALALVHARFSTNTMGAWWLAQPFQHSVHNGEFNTLRGNRNWLKAREPELASSRFGVAMEKLKPIVSEGIGNSDSSSFDRLCGLLLNSGRKLPHVLRMMIPEAWEKDPDVEPARAAFYDYHSTLMEPWDGPALVVATDGDNVASILDRNGLRPCRWTETRDGRVVIASEAGALGLPPEAIANKGRLAPGGLLFIDPAQEKIIPQQDVFAALERREYAQWLATERPCLRDRAATASELPPIARDGASRDSLQRAFGYTEESMRYLVQPMAELGIDPVGAMGSDTPVAALSSRTRSLFDFFTQHFAQVSNPPIDHLRESLVTSLRLHLGPQRNLLDESPEHCRRLLVDSPVLDAREFAAIRALEDEPLRSHVLDITIGTKTDLEAGMRKLREEAVAAVRAGAGILVLSDRGTSADRKPIPVLLATAGVHHHLIRKGLRQRAGLVIDSGEPHVVHHLCALLGYGADAVHPWLAFETVAASASDSLEAERAAHNYKAALEGGLLKVMAKMGITVLESYKGAQIFEAIGLDQDFIDEYFANTPCSVHGIGIDLFDRETDARHRDAFMQRIPGEPPLPEGGHYYWRRDGELHQWNPLTIAKLQQAVRNNDAAAWRDYAAFINEQSGRLQTISGLMDFDIDPARSIPVDEVETVDELVKHFSTGSMSFGSLSQEVHETLAVAMNRLGGKSGTGEGGEQRERFGTERECTMKQVASGRFGVTLDYLNRAKQIEIKMAQGAKPGEGGELPGGKVDDGIAKVRFTVPGVGLISPPPHHDIYSIEDLAQLIHDLKCAAPRAEIHVKLVARSGIGTIAAGVAKAKADAILVSGDSGGTGAAKKTSIKHAGCPWEIGLAEAQQVLVASRLRSRITLRADGGFKTGREVAVAALLGAEEFGFGTAPLVALGCIMLRKCHCNTCSVGIATQDPELRKRFVGKPEHVMNYMRFVAGELREIMAQLGFRSVRDMVGQVQRLKPRELEHPKSVTLDISRLLVVPDEKDELHRTRDQDHKLGEQADRKLWEEVEAELARGERVIVERDITNVNRSYGTLLSADVLRSGIDLRDDQLHINLLGPAGQSFGAFLAPGVTLDLEGEANDYVGKGLSGGRIIVRVYRGARYPAADNILIGNVALYGATRGELYVNGRAGERFAVRNSGVTTVVEGIGDHGCEYMTGGTVLVLGNVGRNFAAGMSGGTAYIHAAESDIKRYLNAERVSMQTCGADDDPQLARDRELIHRLLENHYRYTGSERAGNLLSRWPNCLHEFIRIVPDAYSAAVLQFRERGEDILPPVPPVAHKQAPETGARNAVEADE